MSERGRIPFTLNGEEVEAPPARRSGRSPSARASRSRTSAMRRSRATGPTATAAPAWWRSRASGCWPPPASASPPGMAVATATSGPRRSREMVFELLVADQPPRDTRPRSGFQVLALGRAIWASRAAFRATRTPAPIPATPRCASTWMPASTATLCVRACREVQVNDVIGMAYRGHGAKGGVRLRRPWARAPASPAANASRPARPAR